MGPDAEVYLPGQSHPLRLGDISPAQREALGLPEPEAGPEPASEALEDAAGLPPAPSPAD